MKDSLVEIKNNLQRNGSKVDIAANQNSDLEYKEAKNKQLKQQEEKRIQKNEHSVSSLWYNFNSSNICTIGMPEEEKEQEIRKNKKSIRKK